jgi:hypothetical protein
MRFHAALSSRLTVERAIVRHSSACLRNSSAGSMGALRHIYKEQTPDRVSGSRHYVANLMSRPPQAIFEGWSPRHALTGALGSPGAVPCPFSNCRTVLTGFDDPKVRAHFGEMIAEAVLRSGRGIAVRRGNQDIVEFR